MPDSDAQTDDNLPPVIIQAGIQRPARSIDGAELIFTYKNWRGKVGNRRVKPRFIWFGCTEWHPEPQWLLNGFDLGLDGWPEREFAMKDMTNVRNA